MTINLGKVRSKRPVFFMLIFVCILSTSVISNSGIFNAPQVSAATTYTYTISVEGSNYVARNTAGTLITSSTDFGTVFNAINAKLVSGNTVSIKAGTYLVSTGAKLTKTNIAITGDPTNPSSTTVRAASKSTPTNYLFQMGGSYNTIQGITFDANKNTVISPQFYLLGSYNTVKNNRFINALQYNLETSNADHFQILDNYATNSQYGIATMGFNSWSTNGLISGNTITDCQSAGIKIRNALDVVVENNYIDTAYVQYIERYSYHSNEGMTGLYLSVSDGPSVNITFQNNRVIDSKENKITRGVFMENQNTAYWLSLTSVRMSNIKFLNNYFSGLYYSIITTGSFNTLQANTIILR